MTSRTDPAPRARSSGGTPTGASRTGASPAGASPARAGSRRASWFPPERLRQVGFVLGTVTAYLLDLFLTMAPASERVGHHWLAFGRWDVDVSTYVILLAGAYSALFLRRRWPFAVLVVMTVLALVLSYVSELAQPIVGVLVALYATAAVVERAWIARTSLVLGVVAVAGQIPLHQDRGYDVLIASAIGAAVAGGVWLAGRREQRAVRSTAALRVELAHLQEHAAAAERQRIARELHDILAHSVSAMMMQAAGGRAVARAIGRDAEEGGVGEGDPRWASVEQALATVEATGSQSMRELQRLLGALREDEPAVGVTTSPPGLEALEDLVRITRSSGLVVERHRSGQERPVDWSVGLAGYRVVQESLANAMKHGGQGAVVEVFESWLPGEVRLQVRCRSGHQGFRPDARGGGKGLVGLRQRVELVGGRFEAGWVGDEFVTTADLPLTGAAP
ncbi:sensor histidine kinase [Ornithinimicrobium sp. W1665]|uniref:sensor histidine kinase n=1 Tax=Ornithinimicrobium sp. W1665 TaxID=3416666 RepID=UPI003CF1E925